MEHVKELAALISALGVIFGFIAKLSVSVKNVMEGQKCMLRKDITDTYYAGKDKRQIEQYEYENVLLEYAAYKVLKGNSFVDKLVKEIKEWEVIR